MYSDPILSRAKIFNALGQNRAYWKPVIDDMKVDFVLTGHDHTYARSDLVNVPVGYPVEQDIENGTTYVVSVSGPKMYALGDAAWIARGAEDTQLYQIISIAGDELRYEARTATNRLYDGFVLRKRPGAINSLEELPPTERRRRGEDRMAAPRSLIKEVGSVFQPGFLQAGHDDAMFLFAQERALMIVSGSWEYGTVQSEAPFEMGVFTLPTPDRSHPLFGRFVLGPRADDVAFRGAFALTKQAPADAVDFMQILTSQDMYRRFTSRSGWLPIVRGVNPPRSPY